VSVALELAPAGAHLAAAQVAGRAAELTHLVEPMLNRGQAQTPVRRLAWAGAPYAQRKPHPGHAATTTCAIARGESVCGNRLANRSGHRQSGGYTRSCAQARSWQTGVGRSRGAERRVDLAASAAQTALPSLRGGTPLPDSETDSLVINIKNRPPRRGELKGPAAPACVRAGARIAADALAVHSLR
jgi:hypothetical protein